MRKPSIIAVHSQTGIQHSVRLDGALWYCGATEIECALWLRANVDAWPNAYDAPRHAIGTPNNCISYFSRKGVTK